MILCDVHRLTLSPADAARLTALKWKAKKEKWLKFIKSAADEDAVLNHGCYFDVAAADRFVNFAETFCRLSKGEFVGKPIRLLDWQKYDLFYPIFGWKDAEGLRRYREAYVEVAKKNGKSTIAAIVELYLLVADGWIDRETGAFKLEGGPEVYSAATTREQASIVFREVSSMIRQSPDLACRLRVADHVKTVTKDGSSWIKALAAEAPSIEGINAHGLINDELHVWKDPAFYNALRWATAARRQPLIFGITTAGDDLTSLCGAKHEYSLKIIAGAEYNYRFFGLIYGNDADADIDDPATWHAANPSMGVTFTEERFAEELDQAKGESAAALAAFKRYRLGMWVNTAQPWIPMDAWEQCSDHTFNESDFIGRECFTGLDLGAVDDISALVHVFMEWDETDQATYQVLCRFWLPDEKLRDINHPNFNLYNQWREAGWLTVTPGRVVDYDAIEAAILRDAGLFQIRELWFDRWGATALAFKLERTGVNMIEFTQGLKSFTEPSKLLYTLVKSGRLDHGCNPILAWMAGNVTVTEDTSGNIKPIKLPRTGGRHKKIDGIVALIEALSGTLGKEREGSIYNNDNFAM